MKDHLKNGSLFPSCIQSLYQRLSPHTQMFPSQQEFELPIIEQGALKDLLFLAALLLLRRRI